MKGYPIIARLLSLAPFVLLAEQNQTVILWSEKARIGVVYGELGVVSTLALIGKHLLSQFNT